MNFKGRLSRDTEIYDFRNMKESDKKEAYSYILLAEYDLFKIHLENGVSEEAQGVHPRNLGRFVYDIRSYYDDINVNALLYLDTGLYRGFIAHRKDADKGEYVVSLYVDKDSRKNGVADNSDEGKVLIKEALSFCFEKGYISEEIHSNILDILQNADSGEENVVFN